MVYGEEVVVRTAGFSDIHDLTADVARVIVASRIVAGIVTVTAVGSTASVTTIEFEPALVADFRDKLEEIASRNQKTRHSQTWGDDNGFSHLRASLMGPGISLPVVEGRALLGTWQQIVAVDHDNRPRERRIYIQVVGE